MWHTTSLWKTQKMPFYCFSDWIATILCLNNEMGLFFGQNDYGPLFKVLYCTMVLPLSNLSARKWRITYCTFMVTFPFLYCVLFVCLFVFDWLSEKGSRFSILSINFDALFTIMFKWINFIVILLSNVSVWKKKRFILIHTVQ